MKPSSMISIGSELYNYSPFDQIISFIWLCKIFPTFCLDDFIGSVKLLVLKRQSRGERLILGAFCSVHHNSLGSLLFQRKGFRQPTVQFLAKE